jgi:predicted RNA-binding Zn-ribbon protein involved in translation (DUF1610 family)
MPTTTVKPPKEKIHHCPKCSQELVRAHRRTSEKVTDVMLMGVMQIKRYYCYYCGWEGIRNRFHH